MTGSLWIQFEKKKNPADTLPTIPHQAEIIQGFLGVVKEAQD